MIIGRPVSRTCGFFRSVCNDSVTNTPRNGNNSVWEIVTTSFYFCAEFLKAKSTDTVMRKRFLVLCLVLASVWCGCNSYGARFGTMEGEGIAETGESKAKGVLQGVVTDKGTGETLPFAAVQIEGTALGAVAGLDGSYTFNLAPGTYSIKVSFTSYKTQVIPNIKIVAGQNTHLDVAMESTAISGQETASVNICRSLSVGA